MMKKLILLPLSLLLLLVLPAAAQAFTLQYDGNGQTSGLPPADETSETTVLVQPSSMCKNGALFSRWNSADDGSGADYAPGDTFSPLTGSPTQTLYAIWSDSPETVCASANLSVEQFGPEGSSVLSTPEGISCPATCLAEFPLGSEVLLEALPPEGSVFVRWSGGCSGSSPTCTISSLDDARLVNAVFAPRAGVGIAINKTGTGTGMVSGELEGSDILQCGFLCQATVPAGSSITLQAVPDASSRIDSWSEEGCSGQTCSVLLSESKVVQVGFALLPRKDAVRIRKTRNRVSRKVGTKKLVEVSCLSGDCQIRNVRALAHRGSTKRDLGTAWSRDAFSSPGKRAVSLKLPGRVAKNRAFRMISISVAVVSGEERFQQSFRVPLR